MIFANFALYNHAYVLYNGNNKIPLGGTRQHALPPVNMNVRIALPAEMQAVKQLWSLSFNDFDPYLSWYFSSVSTHENTVVAEED